MKTSSQDHGTFVPIVILHLDKVPVTLLNIPDDYYHHDWNINSVLRKVLNAFARKV